MPLFSLFEIDLREGRHGGGAIELRGEFDLSGLRELSEAVRETAGRWSTVSVDLSGVTFVDLVTLRELSNALLFYPGLSLCAPSREVLCSARACRLEERLGFGPARIAKAS